MKRTTTTGYTWQTNDLVEGQIGLNIADGTAHIRKSDGSIATLGSGGSGTQGIQGITGSQGTQGIQGIQGFDSLNGFRYTWTTGTTPGSGQISFNGTNTIYINYTSADGTSLLSEISQYNSIANSTKGTIYIKKASNDYVIFSVTGYVSSSQLTGSKTIGNVPNSGDTVYVEFSYNGSQGTQGITGNQGRQGIQGTSGSIGIQGVQGIDGAYASQGIQGVQGATGTNGTIGVDGAQGTQGIQGVQGLTGTGTQGLQGVSGAAVETIYDLGTTSGTITPDFANGTIQKITLNGNLTFSGFANASTGQSITLIINTNGTGRTLTSTMKFAGGQKTISTTNTTDIITAFYDGTNYYATLGKGYV